MERIKVCLSFLVVFLSWTAQVFGQENLLYNKIQEAKKANVNFKQIQLELIEVSASFYDVVTNEGER